MAAMTVIGQVSLKWDLVRPAREFIRRAEKDGS
jgi:hypothetical protein